MMRSGLGQAQAQLQHLQRQAAQLVDPSSTPPQRAAQSQLLVEGVRDLAEALALVGRIAPGLSVLDRARLAAIGGPQGVDSDVRRAADQRVDLREQAAQLEPALRALEFVRPVAVPDSTSTGLGVAPLVRAHSVPWGEWGSMQSPVVPGVVTGAAEAEVNPALPADSLGPVVIDDVNPGAGKFDLSLLLAEFSQPVLQWTDPAGQALLDNALLDLVDLAAEVYVGAALVSAAGGTAAYASAASYDAAEGAAGASGKGAAEFVIVNPVDWPAVRRELGPAWAAGPHPLPVVTPGAPAGTVMFTGPGAFWLLACDVVEAEETGVSILGGRSVAVGRPFKLFVRNADAIQTITGVGEPVVP